MEYHAGMERTPLFGGKLNWVQDEWTASDDRVRGGKSQSYLRFDQGQAVFEGHLDTKTLGGAGFASQRTTRDDRHWDLALSDGIEIVCDAAKSDNKVYAFILKDQVLPKSPNGREQSTTSFEYNFKVPNMVVNKADRRLRSLRIPWNDFKPTYRGRAKPDADPLKQGDIKRMSIMMRSFFDSQSGDFCLAIRSIAAYVDHEETENHSEADSIHEAKKRLPQSGSDVNKCVWKRWLCCVL